MPSLAGNFLSLPGKQLARLLARLFFSLGSGDSYYNMNARNMKLDNIANEKFKEYMAQQLEPRDWIQQVSSSLALTDADPLPNG